MTCFALGVTIPLAVLTSAWPREAIRECDPDDQVVVAQVHSSALPNHLLARAKYVAAEVLASASVTLKWVKREPDSLDPACEHWLKVGFEDHAYPGAPADAIAIARLSPAPEPEIRIFLDRVGLRTDSAGLPNLLGHVLAHEIGHLLQGLKRHSSRGVMKGKWSQDDLVDMKREPMRFAPEDVVLIRSHHAEGAAQAPGAEDSTIQSEPRAPAERTH